jgi:CRP-like cAMP-binding protein
MASTSSAGPHNRLLAALPEAEYQRLAPQLQPCSISLHDIFHHARDPIRQVYFPYTGMISEIIVLRDGSAVEVGVVGQEGMIGAPALVQARAWPYEDMGQLPSNGVRLSVAQFRALATQDTHLYRLVQRYVQATLLATAQLAACNRLHPIEERCARWLLQIHDRAAADQFPFTHDFLSLMLGVRRASVTLAAGALQQAGLIRYHRGQITILDRAGLEAASCECYGVIRAAFEDLDA